MPGVIPVNERRKRNKMLRTLSLKKQRAFYTQHQGTTRTVLFEEENRNGMMSGYTDNYIRVTIPFDTQLINKLIPFELSTLGSDNIFTSETVAVMA
jgi:threonylcarbamoyladenosine tRNA methylthiotransferase MtaB